MHCPMYLSMYPMQTYGHPGLILHIWYNNLLCCMHSYIKMQALYSSKVPVLSKDTGFDAGDMKKISSVALFWTALIACVYWKFYAILVKYMQVHSNFNGCLHKSKMFYVSVCRSASIRRFFWWQWSTKWPWCLLRLLNSHFHTLDQLKPQYTYVHLCS